MVMMKNLTLQPIGTIHSPFNKPHGTPIQPAGAVGVSGKIILRPEFEEALQDLEGFSHIILLYYFHLSEGYTLKVKPFLDDTMRGLFATRAPRRPNPIGISVVPLERIEGRILFISNIDVVDGTPLLDIKPYVPEFDKTDEVKIGWVTNKIKDVNHIRSDDRFQL